MTLVDRKSRYLRMGLASKRTKEAVKEMIITLIADFPVHTITCDNVKEFAGHKDIAKALATLSTLILHGREEPRKYEWAHSAVHS